MTDTFRPYQDVVAIAPPLSDTRNRDAGRHQLADVFKPGHGIDLFEMFGPNGAGLRSQGGPYAPKAGYVIVRDAAYPTGFNVLKIESHPFRENSVNIYDVGNSISSGRLRGVCIDATRVTDVEFNVDDRTDGRFGSDLGGREIVGVFVTHAQPFSDRENRRRRMVDRD